jgi:hypothetical protein
MEYPVRGWPSRRERRVRQDIASLVPSAAARIAAKTLGGGAVTPA